MELEKLNGNIIGVISNIKENLDYNGKKVSDIIIKKLDDSLKMVELSMNYKDKLFDDLSSRDKNKIILASKLTNKTIILYNFTKGLTKKDIEFFKSLFKKINSYNRKIILVDKNTEIFLNCVDKIYVINNDLLIYETTDIYDNELTKYCDLPKLVEFTLITANHGIRIDHYKEFDELLKAIYRIKS